MNIPWTVIYASYEFGHRGKISIEEIIAPNSADEAMVFVEDKIGCLVLAMIPGTHKSKTSMYSDEYSVVHRNKANIL